MIIRAQSKPKPEREKLKSVNPGRESRSLTETVIRDILYICRIPYEYYDIPIDSDPRFTNIDFNAIREAAGKFDSKMYHEQMPKPDFLIGGNLFFEVFGYRDSNEDYHLRTLFKIQKLGQFINLRYIWLHRIPRFVLRKYANLLDTKVCSASDNKCDIPLIDGVSLLSVLEEKIPLLSEFGLSIAKSYINWLRARSRKPSFYKHVREKIEKDIPFPQPVTASNEPFDVSQIVSSLSGEYESVSLWSDEEKVAIYFKTPEKLKAIMGDEVQDETLEALPKAASTWYSRTIKDISME